MLAALILFAASPHVDASQAVSSFDFSRSYAVWIAHSGGKCSFFMTDVGMNATQLTEVLQKHYDETKGIEILTDQDTPERCVIIGRDAVRDAGFQNFRVRRGTNADRSPGIP